MDERIVKDELIDECSLESYWSQSIIFAYL